MTTTTPIPTSIAAACAAHDRHRLDVLDALLDEVAPSAVRELLGAALDLCATLRTERDEREEAIGATFAKHRAEIDAATAQLAAARQVIDEERTRAAHASRDLSIALNERDEERATVARLTARAAELEARPVLKVERLAEALDAHGHAALARKVFAHLGPVTLPLPAQDRAEELARLIAVEPIRTGEWKALVERVRSALASLGAPATTPTAAPGPVAAVSVEELIGVYGSAYNECSCSDGRFDDPSCCNKEAIRAVLARLNATTIAPVDPEAVARAYHDHKDAPAPEWDEVSVWRGRDADEKPYASAAMRATLTAAGIPVPPEGGK